MCFRARGTVTEQSDCRHPPSERRVETRTLHGRKVRVEVCGSCGRELVHPLDAQVALHSPSPTTTPTLAAADVVLALLGAIPDRPIINRIVLMKESFLSEKEAFPELHVNSEPLRFIPYDYGPYSRAVDSGVNDLQTRGLISVLSSSQGKKQIFSLTDAGKQAATKILSSLTPEQVERLRRKRKGWDQLGYYGLLRKVYEEYPSYRSKSKIAAEILPTRKLV